MKINRFTLFVIGLCVISIAFIYGCGNATGGGSSGGVSNRGGVYSYSGTQSPGDIWSWTISTSEFIGTNETLGFWITGEWTALSTGFSKATIHGAATFEVTPEPLTPPSLPLTDGTATAYFLEFPNTMLLVRPVINGDERVMVCAAASTITPESGGNYGFVNVPRSGGWDPSMPAFGTVEAIKGASLWAFNVTNYTITGEYISFEPGPESFNYTNGTFTDEVSSSDKLEIFMTPSGVFFGDLGTPEAGGFIGASLETFSSSSEFSTDVVNHTYKGARFVFYPGGSSGTGETELITCTGIGPNTMWASSYKDTETGTIPGHGVYITFEAAESSGFIPANIIDIGSSTPQFIQCAVSQVGPSDKRRQFIYGVGADATTAFNVMMIQTDIP